MGSGFAIPLVLHTVVNFLVDCEIFVFKIIELQHARFVTGRFRCRNAVVGTILLQCRHFFIDLAIPACQLQCGAVDLIAVEPDPA